MVHDVKRCRVTVVHGVTVMKCVTAVCYSHAGIGSGILWYSSL